MLLLIPRTSLLGALMYFPLIINICVLTYATRFEGTRLNTMMLLASLFLLIWDYDRLNLYEIRPGNSEAECRNQCLSSENPAACEIFCDCIYTQGQSLDSCLARFEGAKDMRKSNAK